MATRAELEHEIAVLAVDLKKASDRFMAAELIPRRIFDVGTEAQKMKANLDVLIARADMGRVEMALYQAAARLEALDG